MHTKSDFSPFILCILYHIINKYINIFKKWYYILSNALFCIYLDDDFFFYSILKYIVTCVD